VPHFASVRPRGCRIARRQLARRQDIARQYLVLNITKDLILPFLVSLPFVAFLFWRAIRSGMSDLLKVTRQVNTRTPEQMTRLYVAYGRGAGRFYAKHLRRGDLRVLAFLARDVYGHLRAMARRGSARDPQAEADAREARGVFRGLPVGLAAGFAPGRRTPSGGEHAR